MGKPFEITYHAPYGGIHTQMPENLIDPKFTPNADNFILRNGEIRSRPTLRYLFQTPSGFQTLGLTNFVSNNGVIHTLLFNTNGMYQIQPGSLVGNQVQIPQPWVAVPGAPAYQKSFIAAMTSRGVLYATQGISTGSPHVSAWDGIASNVITDVAFAGTTAPPVGATATYGAYFAGEMDGHLLLAYVIEGSADGTVGPNLFPQRIRWSSTPWNIFGSSGAFGNGLGNAGATFDPTVNSTSGFADIVGVGDWITGLMLLGQVGYIFRQQGITQVTATGIGAAPFEFDHLWASERGIGNVHFFSLAQYGYTGIFISTEDVYQVSPSAFTAIGQGSRDLIMADLAEANATPAAILVPGYAMGFTYMSYHLYIPMVDTTGAFVREYVYSLEDNNWMRNTMRGAISIAKPGIGWV